MRLNFFLKTCCLATVAFLGPVKARAGDCIANYKTELVVGTKEQYERMLGLLGDMPGELFDHLTVRH